MQRFAALFESLDSTTSTRAKVDALAAYFRGAGEAEAAWSLYVLSGRRIKRSVGHALLRTWLHAEAGLPPWLVEETYGAVGDLAETIALLVPRPARDGATTAPTAPELALDAWFEQRLLPLASLSEPEQRRQVVGWWRELPYQECFLVNKLLTGALRVGVSRSLVTRALALVLDRPRIELERALIGDWQPNAAFWRSLREDAAGSVAHLPYPFYLASALTDGADSLGARADWLAEWKWDGIRGQLVHRGGHSTLWSRGEEVITDRFPEIIDAARVLPQGTVLDGEVLAARGSEVLPFAALQRRIGRRRLTAKILAEVPARFVAYDLLEIDGCDWRGRPLRERRARLERLLTDTPCVSIGLSPALPAGTWEALAATRTSARSRGVEGVMLKHWDSAYGAGRQRGAWWKWKVDPFVFDGVLLYAAPGSGRRSNLYTDYTVGVWNGATLVPVAKAYSGLTGAEIGSLDRWIRSHTVEKFGIVRSVEPVQVFELAYEGIAASSRHKSGLALRFPRITRWRTDKPAAEADTLDALRQVLAQQDPSGVTSLCNAEYLTAKGEPP
jgi:DNA ligase-1